MIEAYCPRCRLPRSVHRPSCPATPRRPARPGPTRPTRARARRPRGAAAPGALGHRPRARGRPRSRPGTTRVALRGGPPRCDCRPSSSVPTTHADGLFRWAWSMALDTPGDRGEHAPAHALPPPPLAGLRPAVPARHASRGTSRAPAWRCCSARAHGVLEGAVQHRVLVVRDLLRPRAGGPGGRAGPAVTSDDCRVAPRPTRLAPPRPTGLAPLPPSCRLSRAPDGARTPAGLRWATCPASPDFLRDRVVADSHDRPAWLRARAMGITATDAAHLATPRSVAGLVRAKCDPFGFAGNAYTQYGRDREPVIAEWMRQRFGLHSSTVLFRALANPPSSGHAGRSQRLHRRRRPAARRDQDEHPVRSSARRARTCARSGGSST
jgi:hypothetical protein